jgi:hypothetical protein
MRAGGLRMRRRCHHGPVALVNSVERPSVSTKWLDVVALSGLALVAALATFIAALFDHVTVAAQDGLSRVVFGYPLGWLAQDQSGHSPPFPANTSFISPWENPTSVELGPLMVDVLVVYAILVGGWFFARMVVRRFRGEAA